MIPKYLRKRFGLEVHETEGEAEASYVNRGKRKKNRSITNRKFRCMRQNLVAELFRNF